MSERASLLIVNGCEHTAVGSGNAKSWPDLLARSLDAPLINLAVPDASNHRIVRTTLAAVPPVLTREQLGDVHVVTMFTEPGRTEIRADVPRSGRRRGAPAADRWTTIGRAQLDDGDRRANAWFEQVYSDVDGITEVLLAMATLGRFLTGIGARPLFALRATTDAAALDELMVDRYRHLIDPDWILGRDLSTWPSTALLSSGTATPLDQHRAFASRAAAHVRADGTVESTTYANR